MPQTIFCDEAGFTGNNMLDLEQPFFAYSAVAIEPAIASDIIAKAVRDFRIVGEVKGGKLLRFNAGRKAVIWLLEQCARHTARVAVCHKRYALATHFFEYIFEPVIADRNSIFYNAGLHRFISNLMYHECFVNERRSLQALTAFQELIRAPDPSKLPGLFPQRGLGPEYDEALRQIETFVVCHQRTISAELASYTSGADPYRWMLDLTFSTLIGLLSAWADHFASMTVFADDSKPLRSFTEVFDAMVGRTDRAYLNMEGKRQSVIFNLSGPIQFVRSHEHAGIQLADVVASAAASAFRESRDEATRPILDAVEPLLAPTCIFPDEELVDLRSRKGFVNRIILKELVARTLAQEDLFAGMPAMIAAAGAYYDQQVLAAARPQTLE